MFYAGKQKLLIDSNFSVLINQNLIEKFECVKYLEVYLKNKRSWKTHLVKLCKLVSKFCEMIYKLRYYVPPGLPFDTQKCKDENDIRQLPRKKKNNRI